MLKILGKISISLILVIALAIFVLQVFTEPSNNRNWTLDQQVLQSVSIKGNIVEVKNIRNFTYRSVRDYIPAYYDKNFDLEKLKKVYYVVEPFSGYVGAAHTFLSFEFEENHFLSVSVEIRKEVGESFSAYKGLFNQYELMYVLADERDIVKLRSNYRKDLVYIYPIRTTKEKAQKVFLSMMQRVNKLKEKPEFYNTLLNTCTTNIVSHVNEISPKRVPFSFKVLLPAYSDRLAYDLGLIDTDLSFEAAREKYLINDRANKYADDPDFSRRIR